MHFWLSLFASRLLKDLIKMRMFVAACLFAVLMLVSLQESEALFGFGKKKKEKEKEVAKPTGAESMDLGLNAMRDSFNNPDIMKETMDMMNDPETMAEVERLMQDPDFLKEVEKMKESPEFQKAMQQAEMFAKENPNAMKELGKDLGGMGAAAGAGQGRVGEF